MQSLPRPVDHCRHRPASSQTLHNTCPRRRATSLSRPTSVTCAQSDWRQGQRTSSSSVAPTPIAPWAAAAASQWQLNGTSSSSRQHSQQRPFARPLGTLVQGLLGATTTAHLGTLEPQQVLMLLEVCIAAGSTPPDSWLEKLYATWPAQDAAAPSRWHHTLKLLSLLGRVGLAPPRDFLDTVYYAVGARCHLDFQLPDVLAFLSAASRFTVQHPVDRDLMLSLTSLLLVNDAARLRSATPQQVAELLPCVAAAGHAPGMPLTAAVLSRLLPHLAHSTHELLSGNQCQPGTTSTSVSESADVLSLASLLSILEASAGPAVGIQLPSTLGPPEAAAAITRRLHAELPLLPAPEAVRCLAALAACQLAPCPQPVTSQVLPSLMAGLPQLNARQLSSLAVALQRLSIVPDQSWAEFFHAALFTQLGRFEDSDALVETLDALVSIDRQAGFRALNQLAQSTAVKAKAMITAAPTGSTGAAAARPQRAAQQGWELEEEEGMAVSRLVNTLLVLSYLNHNPGYDPVQAIAGALQPHLSSLSGQQLTNTLWSLAHMSRPPSQAGWLDEAKLTASAHLRGGHLKPYQMAFVFGSLQSLGASLDSAWVDEMLDYVRVHLPTMPSHDVALVLHTVSRLQHVTSYSWMADVEAHVSLRLDSYQPKELTTVVYAMAKLHHRPPSEWLQTLEDNFFDRLSSFSADNLVTLLSSLLDLGHTPGTVFLDSVCRSSETQLPALNSIQLVTLLSALGKVKYQPETEWLAKYLSVLHYHLPLLDASSFSSIGQSLAAMEAQVSSDEWWAVFCHTMRPRLGSMTKGDLLAAITVLPGCGLRNPPSQWCQALTERVLGLSCSGALTPDEAERLVVALGALGVQPPRQLLDDFLGSSLPRLASLPPNRIARLVASFSRANVLPSRNYLEGLVTAARASVYSFTMLELVELTQGLTQLNSRSPQPVPAVSDFLALVKEWL